jgi:lactobin A/cerein 7B family class IIb bacteriocin
MRTFFEGMSTQASGELSDAELDQVAGGKVNAGVVIASVATLGIVCAIGSILDAANNCQKFFHQESSSEGL